MIPDSNAVSARTAVDPGFDEKEMDMVRKYLPVVLMVLAALVCARIIA